MDKETYTIASHMCRIAEHNQCPNAKYTWHRVDGYCQECATSRDTQDAATIQSRRNAQGYR